MKAAISKIGSFTTSASEILGRSAGGAEKHHEKSTRIERVELQDRLESEWNTFE